MDLLHGQHFGGKFSNCVKESGQNAQKLLKMVVELFPSFRDQVKYKGHEGNLSGIIMERRIMVGE